jgi:hypothetical protein
VADRAQDLSALLLPRPCRDADLQRAAGDGQVRRVAIVVDVVDGEVEATLDRWLRVLPGVSMLLFAYPWNSARVEQFVAVRAAAPLSVATACWPAPARSMESAGVDCWATCAAYDASGVHVKRDIEAWLLPVLARSGAVLLAHDPAYGIVRVLQARDLRRRLSVRPRRLRIYRAACRALFMLAWVAGRVARPASPKRWKVLQRPPGVP